MQSTSTTTTISILTADYYLNMGELVPFSYPPPLLQEHRTFREKRLRLFYKQDVLRSPNQQFQSTKWNSWHWYPIQEKSWRGLTVSLSDCRGRGIILFLHQFLDISYPHARFYHASFLAYRYIFQLQPAGMYKYLCTGLAEPCCVCIICPLSLIIVYIAEQPL